MKLIKLFTFMLTALLITNCAIPMAPQTVKQIKALSKALKNDDVASLQTFIQDNSTFNWNQTYGHLGWLTGKEKQTPLSAATWLGAVQCVHYLLQSNVGKIRLSVNTLSSNGFSPLHYAINYPKQRYPHQEPENYKNIIPLLKKHKAINVPPTRPTDPIKTRKPTKRR